MNGSEHISDIVRAPQKKFARIAVVIVTHNSAAYMEKNLKCLEQQTCSADRVIIVDSCSTESGYLTKLEVRHANVELVMCETNVGFCKGNNLGAARVLSSVDYILFLNPDAFLAPAFLERAVEFMSRSENQRTAIVTGTMLGFDIANDKPTALVDSTGIFCKWYGRWFDRGQGSPAETIPQNALPENVPAICGALMFCRCAALKAVLKRRDEVFDERYFMYKEDIELSLRLRRAKWHLKYCPSIQAYHCRGWQADRAKMSDAAKLRSAENELRLCIDHPSHHIVYALAKFLYVHGIEARLTRN